MLLALFMIHEWGRTNLADREELQTDILNERLLLAEGSGNKEVTLEKKVDWLQQGHFPWGDGRGLSGR